MNPLRVLVTAATLALLACGTGCTAFSGAVVHDVEQSEFTPAAQGVLHEDQR
jgi:hypothetical protein